eukprot:12483558-Alexandrium_andersonii.AAC.1
MSASLVGSEMCIRDSLWNPGCAVRNRTGTAHPHRPRSSRRGPPTRTTVSYTHLTLPTICSV